MNIIAFDLTEKQKLARHHMNYDMCIEIVLTNGSVVACYVTLANLKILVISCYLPPANSKYSLNTEDIHKMFSEILKLRSKRDGLIIYGDFNFPTINWSSTSLQNLIETNFLFFIEKFDLIQKIDFHTAATGILDLFL